MRSAPGFLSGWVRGEDYDACTRYANACGALVVSRHGCAPAMPTRVELDHYLANADRIPRPDQDATLNRLHRVTAPRTPRDELYVFAFDHRNQFFELAQQAGADEARMPKLKQLLVEAVAETEAARGLAGRVGILCDDRYGQDALNAATGRGWWIGRPVELPGCDPVVFDRGRSIGTTLIAWPAEQVVKCLVQFHPDDAIDLRLENEAQIGALYEAVQASGHELLLEIIPPRRASRAEDDVCRAMKRLYNLGIYPEWWKLAPMAAAAVAGDRCADRRARPALPRRAGARAERRRRCAGRRFPRRARKHALQGLRRRAHDLPCAGARVARRRDRRRGLEGARARDFRGADRRLARGAQRATGWPHEDRAADDGAGAGPLSGALRVDDGAASALFARRVGDLRPRQRRRHRRGAVRASRRAADVSRAQRAGDGARGDRVCEGAACAAG